MSRRQHHLWSLDERLVFSLIGLVLIVLLLALILGFVVRERGRRELESVRQAMERDGTYRPVNEVTTQPCEEALANGRALLETVDDLKLVEDSEILLGSGLATMRFIAPGRAVPAIAEAIPVTEALDHKSASWADIQTQVDKVRPILTRADAILRNPVAFEHDGGTYQVNQAALAVPKLVVWWRTDALLKLRSGDIEGAIGCAESIAIASRLTGEPGLLVDITLAMGIRTYGLQGLLWEVLQSGSLTDSGLIRLDEIVRSHDFLEDVLSAFEGEVGTLRYLYDRFKANPGMLKEYRTAPAGVFNRGPVLEVRDTLWPLLWSDVDQALLLTEWDQIIKNTRTLRTQTNYRSAIDKFAGPSRTLSAADLWRFPVATSFDTSEVTIRFLRLMVRMEAVRQITLTAIALKRYHLKNHAYPETLQSLVPDYTPSVPLDYFDGTPLKYERLQNGEFLLYSVGDNGLDEKGDPTPVKGKPNLATGKDYVWPKAQKPFP